MSSHLAREVERLKKKLLELSTTVEENVHRAVRAVLDKDESLADAAIRFDPKIDQMEVEVEEDCLKILALYHPVAIDLRFIISVLKINNDLERIGDLSTNIAARAKSLARLANSDTESNLEQMSELVQGMLRDSLSALIRLDLKLAQKVCNSDQAVDELNRETYKRAHKEILKHPGSVKKMFFYVSVSRNLERIADLATNIAEDVIYMIDGEIVRHRIMTID
ncbi:MAG: phosphate signaling complex protein PhoU [Bdellovibrionales bacterium]|nr:phosphate signaling complex protein PhoU [Bdellovibrionales bacterium]